MIRKTAKRGRPRKANPLTSAERMRAYRQRKRDKGFVEVSRWLPADAARGLFSDHRILDARSLALHCRIARKIGRDARLLETARRNLARWGGRREEPLPGYLLEWQQILERPLPEILEFITSTSDDAVRLRQSSPFAGVLTPGERKQVYDAFRA